MTYQLVLHVAGMAWGVIFGLWLGWIWWHQKPTPHPSQEGNVGETPALPGSDVEEQRRNREKMARQAENIMRIAKAWRRYLIENDRSALFAILGMGNSQSDLHDPRRMRREPR